MLPRCYYNPLLPSPLAHAQPSLLLPTVPSPPLPSLPLPTVPYTPLPSPLSHAHSPRYLRGGSQLMLLSRTRTWLPSLARLEVRTPKGSTRLRGQTWDPPSLTHTVLPRRLKINCENKSEKVCGESWAGEGKGALCPTGWKRSYSYKGEMAPRTREQKPPPQCPCP